MDAPTQGIIYVATGARFVAECIQSLHSLRRFAPALDVTVFTDLPGDLREFTDDPHTHCGVLPNPQGNFADKTAAFQLSPYEKTLFLDADTTICRDPSEVFQLLDQFDIAATMETYQPRPLPDVPEVFPEFNAGAILYRRSPAMAQFLLAWDNLYAAHKKLANPIKGEQPAFREVLYRSELRFSPLPVVFNFHAEHPIILPAGATVSVFHGRMNVSKFPADLLQKLPEPRVYLPNTTCLKPSRLTSFCGFTPFLSRSRHVSCPRSRLPWAKIAPVSSCASKPVLFPLNLRRMGNAETSHRASLHLFERVNLKPMVKNLLIVGLVRFADN